MRTTKHLTRLVIYFKDGNRGRFPSNDRPRDLTTGNHRPGLARLRRLVKKYEGQYDTALIYLALNDGLLEKYVNGQRVDI